MDRQELISKILDKKTRLGYDELSILDLIDLSDEALMRKRMLLDMEIREYKASTKQIKFALSLQKQNGTKRYSKSELEGMMTFEISNVIRELKCESNASEKQIMFVLSLQQSLDIQRYQRRDIETMKSSEISVVIDELKSMTKPTEKQIDYALKLQKDDEELRYDSTYLSSINAFELSEIIAKLKESQ